MPASPDGLAPVTAREITAALRRLYPRISLSTSRQEDGTYLVRMPEATARYWGAARDPRYAAAWLTRSLRCPVEILGVRAERDGSGSTALVIIAESGQPWPADPGSSRGIPVYATVGQVTGDFPATTPVRALIQAALDGGLRPHLDPARSPHGPRYRVLLWGTGAAPLTGVLDISETTGRLAEAWLAWGDGPENRYRHDQLTVARAAIITARDLHRAETAARTAHLAIPASPAAAVARHPAGSPPPARPRAAASQVPRPARRR